MRAMSAARCADVAEASSQPRSGWITSQPIGSPRAPPKLRAVGPVHDERYDLAGGEEESSQGEPARLAPADADQAEHRRADRVGHALADGEQTRVLALCVLRGEAEGQLERGGGVPQFAHSEGDYAEHDDDHGNPSGRAARRRDEGSGEEERRPRAARSATGRRVVVDAAADPHLQADHERRLFWGSAVASVTIWACGRCFSSSGPQNRCVMCVQPTTLNFRDSWSFLGGLTGQSSWCR